MKAKEGKNRKKGRAGKAEKAGGHEYKAGKLSGKFLRFHRPDVGNDELAEVSKVFKTGWLTRGPVTERFEKEFCRFIGAKYALAVSSCTAGIELALRICGVGEGDEVVMSPLSFTSPMNATIRLGAKPKFVDVRGDTFNLDESKLASTITRRTKAIIWLHYGGSISGISEGMEIARSRGIFVIEDCAHSLTSVYNGRHGGTFGDFSAFSFYPTKPITTIEGGALACKRKKDLEVARLWHLHGIKKGSSSQMDNDTYYDVVEPGYKFNFTDAQAGIGLAQLKKAWACTMKRRGIAMLYDRAFRDVEGVRIQKHLPACESSYHLYSIVLMGSLAKKRTQVMARLAQAGIQCSIHYPPLHLTTLARRILGDLRGRYPVAEAIGRGIISLPIYHLLSVADVERITREVKRAIFG